MAQRLTTKCNQTEYRNEEERMIETVMAIGVAL